MVDIEEGVEEEFKLAQQMKDRYCDESGKETNPAKAAEIIHQIGQIYRKRSPDKISLIKSAGLFNAAIARNPSNIAQIRSDLSEICQHILQQAKAKNQREDLIKKAEQIKNSISKLRDEVNAFFKKKIPKIPASIAIKDYLKLMSRKISAVQQLNKTIAEKYKQIMADLSQYCEDVMGKPPCEYAIVGMGSLAREEITPYSDFEHIVLLFDDKNYKSQLNYFRWFSVIFHIVVLNLQETIIPSLNISSLNEKNSRFGDWYYDAITPRGISFDGMMPHACKFPLGRLQHTKYKQFSTELIKPVSEMLEYLSSEADLKNGYHLADILTKTCFVFGNENLFKQFADGAQKCRNQKSQTEIINDVQQQVKDDLNSFSTRFRLTNLSSQNTINIKQLVYRSTTIFIAALARLYNISASSCFDIVEEMAKNNKITITTAEKLKCAIAIACEMRLRVYMKKESQCDNAIDLKQQSIDKFLDIVGVTSTINYFQIAYCLQCEIAKQLKFTKLHFYSDPQLINITIGQTFGVRDLANFSKITQNRFWDSSEFDFDQCIEQVEKENKLAFSGGLIKNVGKKASQMVSKVFSRNDAHSSSQLVLSAKEIKSIGDYLVSAEIYDEALEFYKQLLDIYQSDSKNNNQDYDIAMANLFIGCCLYKLHLPRDALKYFYQTLSFETENTRYLPKDKNIARTLDHIGYCNIDLQNYNDAETTLDQALRIYLNVTFDIEVDQNIATSLYNIGRCHYYLHKYGDALTCLNRALEIRRNCVVNTEKDSEFAAILQIIGCCHIDLHNYDDALTYLNHALEIGQNTTLNAEKDRGIAVTLHDIGRCHFELLDYNVGLTYLNRALTIKQNTTLNAEVDGGISVTLRYIGRCHVSLHNYDDALTYLNRGLEIDQNTTQNAKEDRNIALTLHNIGYCYIDLQKHEIGMTYLNRALEIYQSTASNAETDGDIAMTFHNIAYCLIDLHKYDDALTYLNQSLEIRQNTSQNAKTDGAIAAILHQVGYCHIDLHNYDEALTYLNQALEIWKKATLNAEKDGRIALALRNIGYCHIDLHNYDDALTHLNQALGIRQNITPNAEKDRGIAAILHGIGRCFIDMGDYDDALTHLNQASEIFQAGTTNIHKDSAFATTQCSIGRCLAALKQFDNSWNCFEKSLNIYQSTAVDEGKDIRIAITFNYMGESLIGKDCFAEAVTYLQRAFKIYQNLNINTANDPKFARLLDNIGLSLMKLKEFENALNYFKQSLETYNRLQQNEYTASKIEIIRSNIDTCSNVDTCSNNRK